MASPCTHRAFQPSQDKQNQDVSHIGLCSFSCTHPSGCFTPMVLQGQQGHRSAGFIACHHRYGHSVTNVTVPGKYLNKTAAISRIGPADLNAHLNQPLKRWASQQALGGQESKENLCLRAPGKLLSPQHPSHTKQSPATACTASAAYVAEDQQSNPARGHRTLLPCNSTFQGTKVRTVSRDIYSLDFKSAICFCQTKCQRAV